MLYVENESLDPHFNLALEQHLFDTLADDVIMLWRNAEAVIVGVHQNTAEEVNGEFLKQNNIPVVRRLSGGGAVFHDLGNLNFTIIKKMSDDAELDFRVSTRPIVDALTAFGVRAIAGGRNDITVDGKKVSGNARYLRGGRLMHHGTILFDTDFSRMAEAIRPPEDKYLSKGIKSSRARVANLREYLPQMTMREFMASMREHVIGEMPVYHLSEYDLANAEKIRASRYGTRAWNWRQSPEYSVEKRRRIDGVGAVTIRMQVDGGVITDFSASGDYFGNRPSAELAGFLKGAALDERALLERLSGIRIEEYFEGLSPGDFACILLD